MSNSIDQNLNILWTPSNDGQDTGLAKFRRWLSNFKSLDFDSYVDLHRWSADHIDMFWQCIYEYFEIIDHSAPSKIMEGNMPGTRWFLGSRVNYAEHLLRYSHSKKPAIIALSETSEDVLCISWDEFKNKVASFQFFLKQCGVVKGDRVVAYLPNIPEATIAFTATVGLGAVWSSCSPDFGFNSVLDRFGQIEPKVLIACDGYTYNGKPYKKTEEVLSLASRLDKLNTLVWVPWLNKDYKCKLSIENVKQVIWEDTLLSAESSPWFEPVDFNEPLWVLYSSGTTGKPKAITHSHGGILLEHLKYLAFHNDLRRGEKFFWYSTTGWMMWNFTQAALLLGATIVLYEGSPSYPNLERLWALADRIGIQHFGTSAPFLIACMQKGLDIRSKYALEGLRSIGSTGAPLPPEAFRYVYEKIKADVWLASMSGGTDVCTAFVGGNPEMEVVEGEIQCIALGCDLEAWDEKAKKMIDALGEMVIKKPMPSMPIYFWNDTDGEKLRESYFSHYPGVWRHGDWIKITERGTLIIYGRSDATLNRQGVRIGTAEIYSALSKIDEVEDGIIVNIEYENGRHYMPLFVVLKENFELDDYIKEKIKSQLKKDYSPRHVPDEIYQISEVPYTISGKKMEAPVKKILLGMDVSTSLSRDSMRNPDSLDYFIEFGRKLRGEQP